MERQRDENSGRIEATHGRTPEDILSVMDRGDHYTTHDLADKVGIPARTARHYLDKLTDQGRVEKEKVNATTALWIRYE
jgi:predicted ArsR family transcriptional regulator